MSTHSSKGKSAKTLQPVKQHLHDVPFSQMFPTFWPDSSEKQTKQCCNSAIKHFYFMKPGRKGVQQTRYSLVQEVKTSVKASEAFVSKG